MRSKLQPGFKLHRDRYKILDFIKEGGFGAVYRAADLLALQPRIVAIKQNLADDAQVIQAFDFEARILATLTHQNLPRVTDYFAYPIGEFLVMDYIDGHDLDGLVSGQGVLAEPKAIEYFFPICRALHYLHTVHTVLSSVQGPVVHRDVKPANIRIANSSGVVYLVDFGIAKIFLPGTVSQMPAVSAGYSPIEQYEQKGKTDARSDIYSLGATLYFCLTGIRPPEATARASNPRLFVSPRQHNRMITTGMEELVVRCMEMQPNRRFQTALEVGNALTAVRDGKSLPSGQLTGTIQQLGQSAMYATGYSLKQYQFFLAMPGNPVIRCELKGYMMPLNLFNGTNVMIEGMYDGNNIYQVTKLVDLQTHRVWMPKPTLGHWEQLKIELGLMNP